MDRGVELKLNWSVHGRVACLCQGEAGFSAEECLRCRGAARDGAGGNRRAAETRQREREAEETRPVGGAVDGGYPSAPSPTAVKLAWRAITI